MAVFFRGLDATELPAFTLGMRDSGTVLDWSGLDRPVLDKHSTGGVGDKVSLLLAPIIAACGGAVPMLSGRRPGPHGRHARQARGDPRLRHGARQRPPARRRRGDGLRDRRPDRRPRARRPPALRDPRRDRQRRVDPAHRLLDPLQEARGGARRARPRRQARLRRVHGRAGRRARRSPGRSSTSRRRGPAPRSPCSPTWTARSASPRRQRAGGARVRSTCLTGHGDPTSGSSR